MAEASPDAHLDGLVAALKNLATQLAQAGRHGEAVAAFADAAQEMDAGPKAEIQLGLATWLTSQPDPPERSAERAHALAAAVASADSETDPVRGARARRAVRAAVAELNASSLLADYLTPEIPAWVIAEPSDDFIRLLSMVTALPEWSQRSALLRDRRSSMLYDPASRQDRAALAALSDYGPLLDVLHLLDAADQRGLDLVLTEVCAAEAHTKLLRGWFDTPSWIASRQYLRTHPELLADPRTMASLSTVSSEPLVRQHLGIIRLVSTIGLDAAYDIVLDPAEAGAAALAGIEAGNLDLVFAIWSAAPRLAGEPFTGGYVAAVLLAVNGHPDRARQAIGVAAQQAGQTARLAGVRRLRRLTDRQPTNISILSELADILAAPPIADQKVAQGDDPAAEG